MLNHDETAPGARGMVDFFGRELTAGDVVLFPTYTFGRPEVGVIMDHDEDEPDNLLAVKVVLCFGNAERHGKLVRMFGGPVIRLDYMPMGFWGWCDHIFAQHGAAKDTVHPWGVDGYPDVAAGDIVVCTDRSLRRHPKERTEHPKMHSMFWVVSGITEGHDIHLMNVVTGKELEEPVKPDSVLLVRGC